LIDLWCKAEQHHDERTRNNTFIDVGIPTTEQNTYSGTAREKISVSFEGSQGDGRTTRKHEGADLHQTYIPRIADDRPLTADDRRPTTDDRRPLTADH